MPTTYNRPTLPEGVQPLSLASSDLKATELTPKTTVLCINRGDQDYVDKFDGKDYVVPPGYFEVAYEVAAHFRERSVVPGSRNPVTGHQENYIAILGIDPPADCVPFSESEAAAQAAAPEGLDRSDMDPVDRDVKVVTTSSARARTAGKGSRTRDITTEQNASRAAAPDALEPPVGGDAALAGRGIEPE